MKKFYVKRSKKMKHGAAEAKENWQVRVLPALGVICLVRYYGTYKGVPIFRDYNVADNKQVYIGNGQGCDTFGSGV